MSPPTPQSRIRPTALACTECRKQHLKCDAKQPTCTRCLQSGSECSYVPSRRGGRRRPLSNSAVGTARESVNTSSIPSATTTTTTTATTTISASQPSSAFISPNTRGSSSSDGGSNSHVFADWSPRPQGSTISSVNDSNLTTARAADEGHEITASEFADDRFLRLFYEHFHAAHPILVPGSVYKQRNYPHFLQLVVHFVGAQFITSSTSQSFKSRVAVELFSSPDRSSCMVQACLVYSIALYARGEWPESQEALSRSLDIAFELGMNQAGFASARQPETSLEAESLRRTWWELYIADVFMAIPFKGITVRCSSSPPEVALPCEESIYASGGHVPRPCTMLEFKRRVFAAEDIAFSSFSYRIEAAMILNRVVVLNRLRDSHREHLQAVENALVSWVNHLPSQKMDMLDTYGNADEMMFQARCTISYATMLLHLPRSDLQHLLPQQNAQYWPCLSRQHATTLSRPVHSIKATEASKRMSDCVSVCPNVLKYTPFLIPALALCGMIQIATCSSHPSECFMHHCNRVTLILGCLKSTKRTWYVAESAYHCVQSCAGAILSDSAEKWNSDPIEKSIRSNQAASENAESGLEVSQPIALVSEPQDPLLADLVSDLLDPACYAPSFFDPMSNFGL